MLYKGKLKNIHVRNGNVDARVEEADVEIEFTAQDLVQIIVAVFKAIFQK